MNIKKANMFIFPIEIKIIQLLLGPRNHGLICFLLYLSLFMVRYYGVLWGTIPIHPELEYSNKIFSECIMPLTIINWLQPQPTHSCLHFVNDSSLLSLNYAHKRTLPLIDCSRKTPIYIYKNIYHIISSKHQTQKKLLRYKPRI